MDCYSFTNLLTDYLDNQLKLPLRREAEAHLRECPACRQKVEEMSGLVDALHALPEVSASDSFEAVLMEKIRHHKDSLQHPRNLWTLFSNHSRTFSAAAALILVMAGTLVIWRGYNPRLESLPPPNEIFSCSFIYGIFRYSTTLSTGRHALKRRCCIFRDPERQQ